MTDCQKKDELNPDEVGQYKVSNTNKSLTCADASYDLNFPICPHQIDSSSRLIDSSRVVEHEH